MVMPSFPVAAPILMTIAMQSTHCVANAQYLSNALRLLFHRTPISRRSHSEPSLHVIMVRALALRSYGAV